MCIRRSSPGYIKLKKKSVRFFHVKVFSKLSSVPCRADHKQVLKEYQESGINGEKKSCSDIEPHNVSIEHVQIFKSKEGNHPSLQYGVLTRMTIG